MTRRTYINESHRQYSEACQKEVEKMSMHPLSWEEMNAQMKRNHRDALDAAKFIFLDFDGVLNTESWQRRCRENGEPASDDFGPIFDPEAVRCLTTILKAVPEARIVITSDWKREGFGRMKGMWIQRRLPGHVIGMTEDHILTEEEKAAVEKGVNPRRHGAEVRTWFRKNGLEEKGYVILDDQDDFFPEQAGHLVLTSPTCGLTVEDAERAVWVLLAPDILSAKGR